jgi:hypothetical protein
MVVVVYSHSVVGREVSRGGMAEWTMAAVLKTVRAQVLGGSNPSPSARDEVDMGRSHSLVECARLLSGYRWIYTYRGFKSRPPRHVLFALANCIRL